MKKQKAKKKKKREAIKEEVQAELRKSGRGSFAEPCPAQMDDGNPHLIVAQSSPDPHLIVILT